MLSMEDVAGLYCEDYSDQDGADFRFLSFQPYNGEQQVQEISDNLVKQAFDIRKRYGKQTTIKVYK